LTEKTALPSTVCPRGSGPKHIGVIMDGNGRWARQRGQPRTQGHQFRTSNFLLWEGAYSEYFISNKLWPDWTGDDLAQAIEAYEKKERRYGAVI